MQTKPIIQAKKIVARQKEKLDYLFLTISGAHLYGFESENSDLDIRGCHFPSLEESLRYSNVSDTITKFIDLPEYWPEEVDIVSHSLLKYINLLTKSPNGYILEQIFSPLVVESTPIFGKLKELAKLTICKELSHHFGGFAKNQYKLIKREIGKEVKLVLYQLRIIACSLYLAKTGAIQPNLLIANSEVKIFDETKLEELVEIKKSGEKNNFNDSSLKKYWMKELEEKFSLIDEAFASSILPNFDRVLINKRRDEFIREVFELRLKI